MRFVRIGQMGSSFKKAIVPPRVNQVLHTWHKDAKKRLKRGDRETSRENLTGGGQESSEYDDINLSLPVTLAMEEGSGSR